MYSSRILDSDMYFGAHPTHDSYQTYSPYPNFTPRTLSPHDRYYRALAEARSAELEMLEESARQEEALLQRRLQELRQARLEHLRRELPIAPYSIGHTSIDFPPYNRNHSETLRLQIQEEERLAKLEALQKSLLEVQGERLRAVGQDYDNSRVMSLLEEAGLLHKLQGTSRQVDISHPSLVVTNEDSFPISSSGGLPAHSPIELLRMKLLQGQKKFGLSDDLATRHNGRRLHPGVFAVNQTEEVSRMPFQPPRMSHQNKPPTAPTPTLDLNGILKQLGLSAPESTRHQYREKPAHQSTGTNGKEEHSGIQSQYSAETHLFTKAESSKEEKHEKHSSQPSQPIDANLRDQLEKRLNGERENEVRDTIQALLNSLYDIRPASAGAEVSSNSPLQQSAKGKEKEYMPPTGSKRLSSSEAVDDARLQIKEIEKQFYTLEREFIFPTKLDFITPLPTRAGSTPATSCLSFTASNQPIRFFEQSLSRLLIRLDLIESQGNEELRNKRKNIVQKVEHALEDLETEVEERLKAKLATESKRRSVTIEDVTSPDEHLGTEEVSSLSRVDVKTDSISGSPHPAPVVVGETVEKLSLPSTPVPIEEFTTASNLVDEETLNRSLSGQAAKAHAQEPAKTDDSPAQPPLSSELERSELKEVHTSDTTEGRGSGPSTMSVEPVDDSQTETIVQEPSSSTKSASDATAVTRLTTSADNSDTGARTEADATERKGLSDEEVSDISDVQSVASDWSEVNVAIAR